MAEFVAHVRPSRGTVTLTRLRRSEIVEPGSSPESLTDLDLVQDGVPGGGPANTVDLVTNTLGYDSECPAEFQSNTWCANVTLEHFFGRSFSNASVQTLPFPFIFHNQVFTVVKILKRGVVTFGSAGVNIAPNSVSLPSPDLAVPRPGLFVFWDGLDFRPGGVICTRATSDPPPNRRRCPEIRWVWSR